MARGIPATETRRHPRHDRKSGLDIALSTASERPRKERSSEENGGNSIVTYRHANVSSNPGTRPSRLGAENDYSVCTTWAVSATATTYSPSGAIGWAFPELKRRVNALAEEWHPNQILVEDKASGQSLIQELRWDSQAADHSG